MNPISLSRRRGPRGPGNAFTLLELLIVIALIAILITLSVTLFKTLGERSKAADCATRIRDLGRIILVYGAENNLALLPGVRYHSEARTSGDPWFIELNDKGYYPFTTWQGRKRSAMACPSRENPPVNWFQSMHYGVNFFPGVINAIVPGESPLPLTRIAQPSRSAILGEVKNQYLIYPWTDDFNAYPHQGKGNFFFADGHVEALKGPLPEVLKSVNSTNVPYPGDPFPFY